jgi:hypothetical protein
MTKMDYSDIITVSDLPTAETIEANMSYNLHKTGRNRFEVDGVKYEVETDPGEHVLYRMNAMTIYETVYSWLLVAKDMSTDDVLFYLVKTKTDTKFPNWVQVTPEFAETHFYF